MCATPKRRRARLWLPTVPRIAALGVSFVCLCSPLVPAAHAAAGGASRASVGHALTITIALKRADERGFERYLNAVDDRSSPLYRHFLSQQALADRFGPTRATYRRVQSWLRSWGLGVTQTSPNRLTVTVQGPRAAAERAFATPIRQVAGRPTVYANVRAPVVPGALAGNVQAVFGLSNQALPTAAPSAAQTCADPSAGAASPCANACLQAVAGQRDPYLGLGTAFGSLSAIGVYAPGPAAPLGSPDATLGAACIAAWCQAPGGQYWCGIQPQVSTGASDRPSAPLGRVRPASGTPRATTGPPPQKIGLLEFDTLRASDVADWLTLLGVDPARSPVSRLRQVPVNGGVATPGPGESEVLLDIDAALASSPFATPTYVVYDAPRTTSFAQMFQAMILDGDTVISNSWSQCEDQTPRAQAVAIDSVLASAAASGITVLNSAGDSGSTCVDGARNTVGVPADSPHATAVGGSSPKLGPGLTYGGESWWNASHRTPALGAGGFGVSHVFPATRAQRKLTGLAMRSLPDLAYDADPHAGIALCQADAGGCPSARQWGGTSMAAPALAGLVADLNHSLGYNVGDLTPVLYSLAGTSAFHTAAALGTDARHVGLGTPNLTEILRRLARVITGGASGPRSTISAFGAPHADGVQAGIVRVNLTDASGLPVAGKKITLAASSGSSAVVTPVTAVSDPTDGTTVFRVTDGTAESVTFTATDVDDAVQVTTKPTLTFRPTGLPPGAGVAATPSAVPADGSSQATVAVYIQDAQGHPAAGRTVSLAADFGSPTIAPGGAVTNASGLALFTASDRTSETVGFVARDLTDGNVPVPGAAIVTFGAPQPGCAQTPPTGFDGVSVSPFADGFVTNAQPISYQRSGLTFTVPACLGAGGVTFDSSGNAFVPSQLAGAISVLGPAGGHAAYTNTLPGIAFSPSQLGGIASGTHGELYAALDLTDGDRYHTQVVQLDPLTGVTLRRLADLATTAGAPGHCPDFIAVDPISGDIFASDNCGGVFASGEIMRISNPSGLTPILTSYIDLGVPTCGLAFAPDGTLFAAQCGNATIVRITGTNAGTPTAETLRSFAGGVLGIGVLTTNAQGQPTTVVFNAPNSDVFSVPADLGTGGPPFTQLAVAAGASSSRALAVGPDRCAYLSLADTVLRVTGPDCGTVPPAPQLALTASPAGTPTSGTATTLTATLANVAAPAGTPVHLELAGANRSEQVAHADSAGRVTVSYTGMYPGVDTIRARALVNGVVVTSPPVVLRWVAGRHLTALSVDGGPPGGLIGRPVTIAAHLLDVAGVPALPVAGARVTLRLGRADCGGTTSASGRVSCRFVPRKVGSATVLAGYSGDGSHAAASAAVSFAVFAPVRPAITGLRLSVTRFRTAGRGASIARAVRRTPSAPIGTTVSYADSLPATTTFTIRRLIRAKRRAARSVVGRLVYRDWGPGQVRSATGVVLRGRCVTPVPPRLPAKSRVACSTFVAGVSRFGFTGRIHGRRLAPGRYVLDAVASIGGLTSRRAETAFTIVR